MAPLTFFAAAVFFRAAVAVASSPRGEVRRQPDDDVDVDDAEVTCGLDDDEWTSPGLRVRPIHRVQDLSVAEFNERYSSPEQSIPLIFEGLGDGHDAVDNLEWTRPRLRERCGHVPLKITTPGPGKGYVEGCGDDHPGAGSSRRCHNVRVVDPELEGKAWAGLGPADLDRLGISTLADLLDRQDADDSKGRALYLHDAPLLHYCPPAMDLLLGVPKYFRRDYNVLNSYSALSEQSEHSSNFWDGYKGLRHFPSIFVGKGSNGRGGGGTGSPLHADVGQTRFWKLQLSGRKKWRVVSPDDRNRLYPAHPSAPRGSMAASMYRANLFHPDFDAHPRLDGIVVYEGVAQPGDVIYIPEGWPHQVYNMDDSVSVAYNFIDNGNFAGAAKVHGRNLRVSGREEKGDYLSCLWGSFFLPLDDPPPLRSRDGSDELDFVPFRKFFRDQNVRLLTDVPSSSRRLVEKRSGGRNPQEVAAAVGAHRDVCDRPPLHAAASYGHIPLLKYLLDEVGVDPGLRDDNGWTALEVLEELMRTPQSPAAQLLRQRSYSRYGQHN